ncbi:MAG TPA: UDP-N-acetylmuramoyl-L-alanyl-D-glutamate--2,6-diaminopimelate ligase [Actinomycetota bacterium]|nr:UDP-N-acetylmuramoyl-L-alanyl-D-glutamate--2,6-diaminopimelate ligase [Actinomycetota bacterium]
MPVLKSPLPGALLDDEGPLTSRERRLKTSGTAPTGTNGMPLEKLLRGIEASEVRGNAGVSITDVTYRSSTATTGSLFFCVPGSRTDGHIFAADACSRGAAALMVERWVDAPCTQIRVPSVRAAMGAVSAALFGRPSDAITVVGVTGTNGKTTITYLLESIFRAANHRPGVIGTTGVRIDGEAMPFERTTPEAPDLQRMLAEMAERGVQAVAMEVSSHGLDQRRVDGTRFRCGVFTNLSQDHLDYHGTMDAYLQAKARLFAAELSDRGAINWDSPEGRVIAGQADIEVATFGFTDGARLRGNDVDLSAGGLSFTVDGLLIRSKLRGAFNASNCLAAFTAARQVGIPDEAITEGIALLGGVPGRLEPVDEGQPFLVLVDYAHTPDSLDNVLRTARELTDRSLIVVFGCGGDRDRDKRPMMGEVAARLADLTVITSDNPRSEDPNAIIAEIERGAVRRGGRYVVEPDRRAAIQVALAGAGEGDVVVIAGKGHETGQQFHDRTIPFDDRVVASEELRAILGERGPAEPRATRRLQ